jgi:photosystem II stability/assembly factor-like uncharacterized protein
VTWTHSISSSYGQVRRTADGGRNWQTVYAARGTLRSLSVGAGDSAWVAGDDCTLSCPPQVATLIPGCQVVTGGGLPAASCPGHVLATADGGSHWSLTPASPPLSEVAAVSATEAWAVVAPGEFDLSSADLAQQLRHTTDGGTSWHAVPSPCRQRPGVNGDPRDLPVGSISFAGERGWAECVSEPGAGSQLKVLVSTSDSGATWTQVATNWTGYDRELAFLADGHGWFAVARGSLLSTADGGSTWKTVPVSGGAGFQADEIAAVSLTSDRGGKVLAPVNSDSATLGLFATTDGGSTWARLGTFPAR